ncbi:MAG: hypothetical protein IT427_12300 [Pirellulales bacterium]|nr:hypothetical protein [Pirellulales bacterium]
MSDESFDPWKSLASDLGVDPNTAPPPPPPLPSIVPASHAPSSGPEPKKATSDWSALASDLGIEVPPEPEKPIERKDPVAELLGWPTQTRSPEPKPLEADKFEERQPWDAEDVHGRWGDEGDLPLGESDSQLESRQSRRGDRGSSREDAPRSGRNRRGGRSRGRSEGRSGRGDDSGRRENRDRQFRERGDRRPPDEAYRDEGPAHDEERELIADDEVSPTNFDMTGERGQEPLDIDAPNRKRRSRRGRRRGRGGDRAERGRAGEPSKRKSPTATGRLNEPDSVAFGDEPDDIDEIERLDDGAGEEFAMDDAAEQDVDLHHNADDVPRSGGKGSVRDIMTWKEAIGIMIEANMQERARNPRSGGPGGHGGHGGRGRRGGRRNR